MRKILGVSGIALAAILGTAVPASAASSGGAQVYHRSGCDDYGDVTVCGYEQLVYQSVNMPNGDTNYVANGKYDYTVTAPTGYSYSSSGYFHEHRLFKSDEPQVVLRHLSDTNSVPGFGTCTYSGDFHYANGRVQFDNFTYACS